VKDFLNYLKKLSGKVVILSHQNADVDAIASSIALKEAITTYNSRATVDIGVANGTSKVSKRIAEELGDNFIVNPNLDTDLVILLDTSTLRQLSPISENIKKASKIAVIDHHSPHEETRGIADFYIVEEFSSVAEVVYKLILEMEVPVGKKIGLALLLGIISDTGHLRYATSDTLKTIASILDSGIDFASAVELLETPKDKSQKIAQLKAAQRMKIIKMDGWIIVASHVGSFEASSASALVKLGADCAFVGSENNGKITLSVRASPDFQRSTGIHLGSDLMQGIGTSIGGGGGGHPGAAGAKGAGSVEEILEECIRQVSMLLKNGTKS